MQQALEQKQQGNSNTQELVSMKLLLETGVHFGHKTRRWNPKMKQYIFTQRNGIHIIDLQQTVGLLAKAYDYVKTTVANGGVILFVGTKKQAQEAVESEAKRCGMPFVSQRWLGGTLTNYATIALRITYLEQLEQQKAKGEFARYSKKDALKLEEELAKLNHHLSGIKALKKLPDALFVVDPGKEAIAIAEARRMKVPIVAINDTDCDPNFIDHPIPGNDDAIRSVRLMTGKIADAVLEGNTLRQQRLIEEVKAAEGAKAEAAASAKS
ncbi:MAG: 30S ribosomal protein S2 [Chloroflexi bacterium]|nr:30S ribosomal protein S2 [Chloroflexota bacterium]